MCGRFTLAAEPGALARELEIPGLPDLPPRFNVAPSQEVAIVLAAEGGPALAAARWGLVPAWAKDPSIGNRLFLARAEGIAEKPAFAQAFREGRCLVPVTGFFEWKGQGKHREPWLFRRADGRPFVLAGVSARRGDAATMALVTTTASELVGTVHDRMPVILEGADRRAWLDAEADAAALLALLRPVSPEGFTAVRVSRLVNHPGNDVPAVLEPAAEPDPDDDLPLFRRR